jgi:DNA primase
VTVIADRIECIHERYDLLEEMEGRLGPGKRDGVHLAWLSPFHEEKTPSFKLKRGEQRFRCYGCGMHGDVIDLVAELDGISTREAIERLAGPDYQRPSRPPRRRQEPGETTPATHDQFAEYMTEAQRRLAVDPEAEGARRYLRGRGVFEQELCDFGLGYGFAPAPAKLGSLRGRIVFDCRPYGVEGRVVPGEDPRAWNGSQRYITVGDKGPWGLGTAQPSRGPLVLVEGLFDRIALERAGHQAVALRGKVIRAAAAATLHERGFTHVYVLLDPDTKADDWRQLGRRLHDAWLEASFIRGLSAGDPGDLLLASEDELLSTLSAALVMPVA